MSIYKKGYARNNFGKKLLLAIDYHYSDLPKRKRNSKFKDDFCISASIERKKFEDTFNSWVYKEKLPHIETIIDICNILDCEIDYLLTEQETFTKNTENVSKTTGLSPKAIEKIQKYSNDDMIVLNSITKRGDITYLTGGIDMYFQQLGESVKIGNNELTEETQRKLIATMCSDLLKEIFDGWVNYDKDIVNHFFRKNLVKKISASYDVSINAIQEHPTGNKQHDQESIKKITQQKNDEIAKINSTDYYTEMVKNKKKRR